MLSSVAAMNQTAVPISNNNASPPGGIFSWFTYKKSHGGYVHVPVEPLWGLPRDPRKCWEQMTERYTQSKAYLLYHGFDSAAFGAMGRATLNDAKEDKLNRRSRAMLFDAGATVASSEKNKRDWSGTDYIVSTYKEHGIEFDDVYAWEPR
jgi:hypothetical protein